MTHTESVRKYNNKTYDRIEITVPKGFKKTVQAHAEKKQTTVNKLINDFLEKEIKGVNDE